MKEEERGREADLPCISLLGIRSLISTDFFYLLGSYVGYTFDAQLFDLCLEGLRKRIVSTNPSS